MGFQSYRHSWTIKVFGIKDWDDFSETVETLILNGTTNVPTANAYVMINRLEILTKGATSVNVGTITATAQTDGTVTSQINPGVGQTNQAIVGLCSTQTGFLKSYYASFQTGGGITKSGDISLVYNPEPNVETINFLVKDTRGLMATGSSAFDHTFEPPKVFIGPGIIKVQALTDTADSDVSAGFDIILFTISP